MIGPDVGYGSISMFVLSADFANMERGLAGARNSDRTANTVGAILGCM